MCASLGFKRACIVILNYPALVLTPCFGTWTFGPIKQQNSSTSNCCTTCKSDLLAVSYLHTWINYAISVVGSITTFFVWIKVDSYATFEDFLRLRGGTFLVLISWIIILIILPMSIGFIHAVDNCCKCLCTCCPAKCFPVIERTELRVDNNGNLVDVEEQSPFENLSS